MSYILEALKKSEQTRGGGNAHEMGEEFHRSPAPPPRTSPGSRRWLYLIAFILVLNLSFFVFWTASRRSNAPALSAQLSGTLALPAKPAGNLVAAPAAVQKPKPPGPIAGNPAAQAGPAGKPAAAPAALKPREKQTEHEPAAKGGVAARPPHPGRRSRRTTPVPPAQASRAVAPKPKTRGNRAAAPAAAEHLKELLEKQAQHVDKTPKAGSNTDKLADIRDFEAPESSDKQLAPSIGQLPPRVRESLPDISMSMLVYSRQPSDRFVYINGTKRHEGDEISPGLKVKRITPDGAVFTYLGLRFYKSVIGN